MFNLLISIFIIYLFILNFRRRLAIYSHHQRQSRPTTSSRKDLHVAPNCQLPPVLFMDLRMIKHGHKEMLL